MFKKLLETVESAGLKSGELACPTCGLKPEVTSPRADDAITCKQCGTAASALEWSTTASGRQSLAKTANKPATTKITRKSEPAGAIVWEIPASGKSGGFLVFAIIWCGFTAILSSVFLFGNGTVRSTGGMPVEWFVVLFFGIFWVVGLGMLYVACLNKYAKHRLSAGRDNVTLHRELFGRSKAKSLPADSITSIAEVVFYHKNYQPVNGIEIRGDRGKLRFGSVLTDEEKSWLVADLRRVILRESAPEIRPEHTTGMRQACFSFALPKSGSSLLPHAIMLLLMGVGFIFVGIYLIEPTTGIPAKSSPTFVKAFDFIFNFMSQGFRVIWTLMSATMAAAGLALLVWLKRTCNQETRVEGTDSEVAIRTTRRGLVLKERVFPRASVANIRCSASGSSNGKPMKRVELIVASKSEVISRWVDGEKADAFVEEVRRALI